MQESDLFIVDFNTKVNELNEETPTNIFDLYRKDTDDILEFCVKNPASQENFNQAFDKIKKIKNDNKMIIYSQISSNVYVLCPDEESKLLTFFEMFATYEVSNDRGNDNELKSEIFKIFDQINSALYQKEYVNNNLEAVNKEKISIEYEIKKLMKKNKQIKKSMDESKSSIMNQLISIVSIFTAISFVLFGGISSFQSIFSNLATVSLQKLVFLSTIWGIGMVNVLFTFIYYISKIVGGDIKSDKKSKYTVKKYPYIIIVNVMLLSVLAICTVVAYYL